MNARNYANRLIQGFIKLILGETAAGVLLIMVAFAAMLAANSPLADAYHGLFHHQLAWTPVEALDTLHDWINDALMAVFFFVVGLEIKREILGGALADPARRRLPVVAAAAGMAVPALVYLAVSAGAPAPAARGWAIPAATDIAFALGVLGLLGRRVPPSLRLFLLTVAIIDDLGAVAIIAVFYTTTIDPVWLAGAAAVVAVLVALNRAGAHRPLAYILPGVLLWLCVLHSGIHATIAGVALAFAVPYRSGHGTSPLVRLEHALVPWNGFLVVPLFGLANAGVAIPSSGTEALVAPVPLGVALGLFLGKQAGVFGAMVLCDRTGLSPRPAGMTWLQVWGLAVLCGIGFTMSLFIGALAFPGQPALVEEAKLGVLAGSVLSALLGYTILRFAPSPRPSPTVA